MGLHVYLFIYAISKHIVFVNNFSELSFILCADSVNHDDNDVCSCNICF